MSAEKGDFNPTNDAGGEKRNFDPVRAPNGEKRNFDPAAATWDENPTRVQLAGDVARAIRGAVNLMPAMDVLDFGCGTGLLTLQIRPQVNSITGIDTSRGMLDVLAAKIQAQGLTNVKTRLVDLDLDELPAAAYDLVVSSMTFHHVADVRAALAKLAAAIRPGGFLAVADLDKDDGKFHESPEGVFHNGFDRCIMKRHFEVTGFVSVRNRTAAIVRKPGPDGQVRTFTVFLMTGQKPG